jgi:N-acyl-D-amino-acid deacylase
MRWTIPALATLIVFGVSETFAAQQDFDIIIRNGRVLDGTGNPWLRADIGISGDRITFLGDLSEVTAPRTLDAEGLYVAPGFIDVHSHAGPGLAQPELSGGEPLLAQGLTTVFVNPDGGGPLDLVAQREAMERIGTGVNVVQMIGHNTVRRHAMGGSHDRPPTEDEMSSMKTRVREAMEAGAVGLSTGLFYTPGAYAETDEVTALAAIVAQYDGIHSSHIRDESDYDMGVVASVQEIIDISQESGVAGIVSHIKALGPNVWGESETIVRMIATARADGLEVWADQYPYHASSTGLIAAIVPAWAREGGVAALRERLEDAELKQRKPDEMLENIARRGGADRIQFTGAGVAGQYLDQLAETRGLEPVDAAIELIREASPSIISYNMHEDDIHRFMQQPFTITCTDGGLPVFGQGMPHPRTYGAFSRKLRKYVREEGVLDLPQAIATMTGTAARVFRLDDRGTLRPGMIADIVVFDFERIDDPATFEEPHQYAEGMVHVLVGGRFAIRDGEFTGVRAGAVLAASR